MSKRARKGGEIGINGETYAGGTFLPSTRLPKQGKAARLPPAVGRCLVEPGVFAISPTGTPAIFSSIAQISTANADGTRSPFPATHPFFAYSGNFEETAALCDRFNAGERWL